MPNPLKIIHVYIKRSGGGERYVSARYSNGEIAFATETYKNKSHARRVAKFFADKFDAELVDQTNE